MELVILHADDRLVAVDKPSGVLVHRSAFAGDEEASLARSLRARVGRRVHAVHRIDRGASGVVLFALDAEAAAALRRAFDEGLAERRYLAIVRGAPPERGVIDADVPRAEGGARVPARTRFRTLAVATLPGSPLREARYALVEACPETGRFHQVRRHLKHLGHPVIGDANYGRADHNALLRERIGLARLALHAASLGVPHPAGGALRVEAPLPADLASALAALGLAPPLAGGAAEAVADVDRVATVTRT